MNSCLTRDIINFIAYYSSVRLTCSRPSPRGASDSCTCKLRAGLVDSTSTRAARMPPDVPVSTLADHMLCTTCRHVAYRCTQLHEACSLATPVSRGHRQPIIRLVMLVACSLTQTRHV